MAWQCPALEADRLQQRGCAVFAEIGKLGAASDVDCPEWSCGLAPDPRRAVPAACKERVVKHAGPAAGLPLSGDVFIDGSVSDPTDDALARGGWAAVMVDKDGDEVATVLGPLTAEFPQQSSVAEIAAACEALKHCDRCREDFPCSEDAWIFPEVAKMKYRKQQTTGHVDAEMA